MWSNTRTPIKFRVWSCSRQSGRVSHYLLLTHSLTRTYPNFPLCLARQSTKSKVIQAMMEITDWCVQLYSITCPPILSALVLNLYESTRGWLHPNVFHFDISSDHHLETCQTECVTQTAHGSFTSSVLFWLPRTSLMFWSSLTFLFIIVVTWHFLPGTRKWAVRVSALTMILVWSVCGVRINNYVK